MLTTPAPGPHTPRYLLGFDLRRRPHLDADVLVVGGGVAGLCAALAAADAGKEVLLLAKAEIAESNTFYAQGGVAAVLRADEREPADSLELHVRDTLVAGAGLAMNFGLALLAGFAPSTRDVIRTRGIVIVDDRGRGDPGTGVIINF